MYTKFKMAAITDKTKRKLLTSHTIVIYTVFKCIDWERINIFKHVDKEKHAYTIQNGCHIKIRPAIIRLFLL